MTGAFSLRASLRDKRLIVAPGAADTFAARPVQAQGFGAVYMTGLGAAAVRLNLADLGLMTQTEVADHARAFVRPMDIR